MKFFARLALFISTVYTLMPLQAMNKINNSFIKNKNFTKFIKTPSNTAFSTTGALNTPIKENNLFRIKEDPSGVQWSIPIEPEKPKPNYTLKNIPKGDYYKIKDEAKKTTFGAQKRNFSTGKSPFNKSTTGFTSSLLRNYSTNPPVDPHAGKALFDMLKNLDPAARKKLRNKLAFVYHPDNGTWPNEMRMAELNQAQKDLDEGLKFSTWSGPTGSSSFADKLKNIYRYLTFQVKIPTGSSSSKQRIYNFNIHWGAALAAVFLYKYLTSDKKAPELKTNNEQNIIMPPSYPWTSPKDKEASIQILEQLKNETLSRELSPDEKYFIMDSIAASIAKKARGGMKLDKVTAIVQFEIDNYEKMLLYGTYNENTKEFNLENNTSVVATLYCQEFDKYLTKKSNIFLPIVSYLKEIKKHNTPESVDWIAKRAHQKANSWFRW